MGFRSLQHAQARKSTARGFASTRYVPPSGFGYPRGGLLLPSPSRLFFAPAALMGFALRSFLLPERIRRVSAGKGPRAVFPVGIPVRRSEWAGPTGRGFWASPVPRVPGSRTGVSSPTAGCSLGLHPPRAFRLAALPGISPRLLSHALQTRARRPESAGVPESRSAPAWPRPPRPASRPPRAGQPFQGSCTSTIPDTRASPRPGYVFTSCRAAHYCRPSTFLGRVASLYRSYPGFA
jgi:hypothetical protein